MRKIHPYAEYNSRAPNVIQKISCKGYIARGGLHFPLWPLNNCHPDNNFATPCTSRNVDLLNVWASEYSGYYKWHMWNTFKVTQVFNTYSRDWYTICSIFFGDLTPNSLVLKAKRTSGTGSMVEESLLELCASPEHLGIWTEGFISKLQSIQFLTSCLFSYL